MLASVKLTSGSPPAFLLVKEHLLPHYVVDSPG